MTMAQSFRLHKDYSQLSGGVQRRPAAPLGVPALVAHMAFWQPGEGWTKDSGEPVSWDESVDRYVHRLYVRMQRYSEHTENMYIDQSPNIVKKGDKNEFLMLFRSAVDLGTQSLDRICGEACLEKKFDGRGLARLDEKLLEAGYKSVSFKVRWHGIYTIISIEKRHEFVTLTVFMDISVIPIPGGTELFGKVSENFQIFSHKCSDYFLEINEKLGRAGVNKELTDGCRKDLRQYFRYFYEDIWGDFFQEVILSQEQLCTAEVRLDKHDKEIRLDLNDESVGKAAEDLGDVFADFRAMVIGPNNLGDEPSVQKKLLGALIPMKRGAANASELFREAGWRQRECPRVAPHERFSNDDARKMAQSLWPFITADRHDSLPKREFVVSRYLDGRVIYMSALGAQPSPYFGGADQRQDDQVPLYYLLYAKPYSEWQLGRLVNHLNQMGTLRLAAIQDLRKLRGISKDLRKLEIPRGGLEDSFSRARSSAYLRKWERAIFRSLNDMTRWEQKYQENQKRADGRALVNPGSIIFRIERARYYIKQFDEGMQFLRIRRVEGYQPYGAFMKRHIGTTFDFIDRLGVRLERTERRVNDQSTALLSRMLVELQRDADILVWVILAPYYLHAIAGHILGNRGETLHKLGISHPAFGAKLHELAGILPLSGDWFDVALQLVILACCWFYVFSKKYDILGRIFEGGRFLIRWLGSLRRPPVVAVAMDTVTPSQEPDFSK